MRYDYTFDEIVDALRKIGISEGDDIFLHSNLGFYGMLKDCGSAGELCEGFTRAMQSVVGSGGTIIVPTFSYSYCKGEIYDPAKSGTTCGMLSEYYIAHYSNNRTMDPNFSVCGVGGGMGTYMLCDVHESFGERSFWAAFRNRKGKFVSMNIDASSTFMHYIERMKNVPYRYNKAFNGVSKVGNRLLRDYAVHYVFDSDDDYPCYERVSEIAISEGIVSVCNLGRGTMLAYSSDEYFDLFYKMMDMRPRVMCRREQPN